jgi:phage gp16-like protein
MPKRISKDVNQAAFQMVRRSTGTESPGSQPKVSRSEISRVMAEMGRKGGRIGGKRRLETMTEAERKQVATNAAKARWGKREVDKSS